MTIRATVIAALLTAALGCASGLYAGSITVGIADNGNCYPFMCNDSGTNSGPSIQYQQVYASSAFGTSPVTITSETFYWQFAQQFGGNGTVIGGTYEGFLSTTSAPVDGLNANCLSCNLGTNNTEVFDFTLPPGGVNIPPGVGTYTIDNTIANFLYNPSQGNLLLDIVVTNQDNVPNGSGNSYMDDDDTGTVMSRAYAFLGSNSGIADSNGLVTTFGTGTTGTPEPSTLLLLGTGLLGLAGGIRRKLSSRSN